MIVIPPVPKSEPSPHFELEDGIPVIQHGPDAVPVTSEMVRELLDEEYLHFEP